MVNAAGLRQVSKKDNGWIVTSRSQGWDADGVNWTRETREEVTRNGEGSTHVHHVTATQRPGKDTVYEIQSGTYVQHDKGKGKRTGYTYTGKVEKVIDGKVVSSKQIRREHRKLPANASAAPADA